MINRNAYISPARGVPYIGGHMNREKRGAKGKSTICMMHTVPFIFYNYLIIGSNTLKELFITAGFYTASLSHVISEQFLSNQ